MKRFCLFLISLINLSCAKEEFQILKTFPQFYEHIDASHYKFVTIEFNEEADEDSLKEFIFINGSKCEILFGDRNYKKILIPLSQNPFITGLNEVLIKKGLRSARGKKLMHSYSLYFFIDRLSKISIEEIPLIIGRGKWLKFCFTATGKGYYWLYLNGKLIKENLYGGKRECEFLSDSYFNEGWNTLKIRMKFENNFEEEERKFYYDSTPPQKPSYFILNRESGTVCFGSNEIHDEITGLPYMWSLRVSKRKFFEEEFSGIDEVASDYLEGKETCISFEEFLLNKYSPSFPFGGTYFIAGRLMDTAGNPSSIFLINDEVFKKFSIPLTSMDGESGDFDGDGWGDFAISISGDTPLIYIYRGSDLNLFAEKLTENVSPATIISLPENSPHVFLSSGDLNLDGRDELVAGMPSPSSGVVQIFSFDASLTIQTIDSITSTIPSFGFETEVFDFNCDGIKDIFISSPYDGGGKIEVRNGMNFHQTILSFTGEGDEKLGEHIKKADVDFNGDKCEELFVFSPRYNAGKGRVLWLGGNNLKEIKGEATTDFPQGFDENYYGEFFKTVKFYDRYGKFLEFAYQNFKFELINSGNVEEYPIFSVLTLDKKIVSSLKGGKIFINKNSPLIQFSADNLRGYLYDNESSPRKSVMIKKGNINRNEFIDILLIIDGSGLIFIR